jgi:transaldolase
MGPNPLHPLHELAEHGQSVWLDDLTREMLEDGTLAGLIRDDGVTGLTSNPKTFSQAIAGNSRAYEAGLREAAARGRTAEAAYEGLAVEDVRAACDLLRDVHDRSAGQDGFVSLEVSPHLAFDTQATIEEAHRLWERVERDNVLIKIPGTSAGLGAIEACLAGGVNVNVTLLFSLDRYREVADAWFRGMETRVRRGEPLGVRSVASFFLSRIDVKVDALLDEIAEPTRRLRGRAAVASARLAYQIWKRLFSESNARWQRLSEGGASPQKLLWASTSTKDPSFSDTKYVEALIGDRTINTMPRETLAAFRDHGEAATPTLELEIGEQRTVLDDLGRAGIDLAQVTEQLVEEGVEKFVRPFDDLLQALEREMGSRVG